MNRCNNCLKDYDKKEVARVNGKESMVHLLGYCSAQCYTEMVVKLENQKKQSVTG
jgi:hypothetical protein